MTFNPQKENTYLKPLPRENETMRETPKEPTHTPNSNKTKKENQETQENKIL